MNHHDSSSLNGGTIALLFVPVFLVATTTLAQNLVNNSDFRLGEVGNPHFGWILELAENQQSECTLVTSRRADGRALRLYNDEFGDCFYQPGDHRSTLAVARGRSLGEERRNVQPRCSCGIEGRTEAWSVAVSHGLFSQAGNGVARDPGV